MPPPMQQPPMPPSMQQPPPPPPAYGGMQQQPPPPAPMAAPPPQGAPSPNGPTLAAFYAGQRFVVNKDRFIIGRGKQSSDLTIKDPNVSRQHAMVEFLNGQYYMVDMGSTNGVEYNGQRIARKAIAEGDLYRICDHEVRFTYR
jgi:neural Wiskott-Aldrich syndrome protein